MYIRGIMFIEEALARVQAATHHDPLSVLGCHSDGDGFIVREFCPQAESVELDGVKPMQRVPNTDIFECKLSAAEHQKLPTHYKLYWHEKYDASQHSVYSPYSFSSLDANLD